MAPLYQVIALPGQSTQSYTVTDAYVPASESNAVGANNPNLSAFMIGTADPTDYGQLTVYETPQSTTGPANADSYIQANQTVSKDITLLNRDGSQVLLGNTLMVPVGQAILYLRPLYVAASSNPLPQLTYVIGVLGTRVVIDTSLSQTLSDLLNTTVSTVGPGGSPSPVPVITGTVPVAVQQDLAAAQSDYEEAVAALTSGALGTYQTDIQAMEQQILNAQTALKAASGTTVPTTTTTTAPAKGKTPKGPSKTPTSTEPRTSTTTTTLASAAAPP
jgi:hypothetical protein